MSMAFFQRYFAIFQIKPDEAFATQRANEQIALPAGKPAAGIEPAIPDSEIEVSSQ